MVKTLAIETSCDDTSIGIISYDGDSFQVEKLLAYSQIADHQKFGGVLPEIASRLHSEKIIAILQNIGRDTIAEVDFISATTHPGLPGSLVVGKSVATMLAEYFHKPLLPVNHIHGHIFSILLERKLTDLTFPMVILTASGGHNDIYLVDADNTFDVNNPSGSSSHLPWQGDKLCAENGMYSLLPCQGEREPEGASLRRRKRGLFNIQKLAYTLDDASGEAFDKVSKMLGGSYPGWPRISEQASKGNPNPAYQFKRIFLPQDAEGRYPFSFSWMKSQVSFLLDKIKKSWHELTEDDIHDIAYEFQEATVETLAKRLLKVAKEYGAKTIAVAGWVSANNRLIEYLTEAVDQRNIQVGTGLEPVQTAEGGLSEKIRFLYPIKKVYSTDNGAMIWVAGILAYNNR